MTRGLRHLPLFFATVLALVGCNNSSPKQLVANAVAAAAKGDQAAAAVSLKAALQIDPSSAEARFLLGQVLASTGNFAGAEVEFRKALELNYPKDKAATALSTALLTQGKYKKIIDEFGIASAEDGTAAAENATLRANIASAYLFSGAKSEAQRRAQKLFIEQPKITAVAVLKARVAAVGGDTDGALKTLAAIETPTVETWRLTGDILSAGKDDLPAAIAAYRKALALDPKHLQTQFSIVQAQLRMGDKTAATQQLEALKKVAANHPDVIFLDAQLAFLNGERVKAAGLVQQLLRMVSADVRVLHLAGAIELQRNAPQLAEKYLIKALSANPEHTPSRQLLAQAYLASAQPAKALATLKPLLEKTPQDAGVMTTAAVAYLQSGAPAKAEEYFQRAAKLKPDDIGIKTSLALNALSRGQADAAFSELQAISNADDGVSADLAIIATRMRRGDTKQALEATAALVKKKPQLALAHELRARALLASLDVESARAGFAKALEVDPGYFAAVKGLADLDVSAGNSKDAENRLAAFAKATPGDNHALLALAEIKANRGATTDEVSSLIDEAKRIRPSDPAPRLAMINHLLLRHSWQPATTLAQASVAEFPGDADLLDALGRAQMTSGDSRQALATFNKLASMQPLDPGPWLRSAEVAIYTNDLTAAESHLRRALTIKPDFLGAQRTLIAVYLRKKMLPKAIQVAKDVQRQRPTEALGWLMEGDIQAAEKNWAAAVAAFRPGLDKAGTSALPARLHMALNAGGKAAEADQFENSWRRNHAKDEGFIFYLADFALAQRKWESAEQRYQDILSRSPTNLVALNNLAWLLAKQKKAGAVEMAEKALALRPGEPSLVDTLAFALSAAGKHDRAIEAAQRAVAAAPANANYRLGLARVLIAAGDKPKAKLELEKLSLLGSNFSDAVEVKSLLGSL